MVAAEYEAIQLYMQLAEPTNHELAAELVKDIADEERAMPLSRRYPPLLTKRDPPERAIFAAC